MDRLVGVEGGDKGDEGALVQCNEAREDVQRLRGGEREGAEKGKELNT